MPSNTELAREVARLRDLVEQTPDSISPIADPVIVNDAGVVQPGDSLMVIANRAGTLFAQGKLQFQNSEGNSIFEDSADGTVRYDTFTYLSQGLQLNAANWSGSGFATAMHSLLECHAIPLRTITASLKCTAAAGSASIGQIFGARHLPVHADNWAAGISDLGALYQVNLKNTRQITLDRDAVLNEIVRFQLAFIGTQSQTPLVEA